MNSFSVRNTDDASLVTLRHNTTTFKDVPEYYAYAYVVSRIAPEDIFVHNDKRMTGALFIRREIEAYKAAVDAMDEEE
jgi:hypothetical protein